MKQFVKCINNDCVQDVLIVDKKYKVLGRDGNTVIIKDENGNTTCYNNERFSPCVEDKENNIHDKLNSLKDLVLFYR